MIQIYTDQVLVVDLTAISNFNSKEDSEKLLVTMESHSSPKDTQAQFFQTHVIRDLPLSAFRKIKKFSIFPSLDF